jgi:hypothetical protein
MKKLLGTMLAITSVVILIVILICCSKPYVEHTTMMETTKDSRFIAYDNGTVLDTKTKLMWATKDNGSDILWQDAKFYCENYHGGGYTDWRMPTQDELAGLYDAGKTYTPNCGAQVHLTELIHLTCTVLWASDMRGSKAATLGFITGSRFWNPKSFRILHRALPVRSGK